MSKLMTNIGDFLMRCGEINSSVYENIDAGIIVISGAPGTGKSTMIGKLLERFPEAGVCISCTTRKPRTNNGVMEQNGREYFFLTEKQFKKKVREDKFVEWKRGTSGELYGTSRSQIEHLILQGKRVIIIDADPDGARRIRSAFPKAKGVFIMPPSFSVLEERLRGRGEITEEEVMQRLADGRRQVRSFDSDTYRYVLVNDDLARTTDMVATIIQSVLLEQDRHGAVVDRFLNDANKAAKRMRLTRKGA